MWSRIKPWVGGECFLTRASSDTDVCKISAASRPINEVNHGCPNQLFRLLFIIFNQLRFSPTLFLFRISSLVILRVHGVHRDRREHHNKSFISAMFRKRNCFLTSNDTALDVNRIFFLLKTCLAWALFLTPYIERHEFSQCFTWLSLSPTSQNIGNLIPYPICFSSSFSVNLSLLIFFIIFFS